MSTPRQPGLPDDRDAPPASVGAGFDFADPHGPLAAYYLSTSHVVAVALLAGVFILLNYVPLWHTDIWGHLKFGEWIVANRQLPDGDPNCPFADQVSGTTYPGQLGQAVVYVVFQFGQTLAGGDHLQQLAGGVETLRFSQALVVTLRMLVMLLAFRRISGSISLACWALGIMLALSLGNLAVARPQVLGELFFALLLLGLSRPVLSPAAVVGLPILFVVWANSHGSFSTGLMLLAASILGRALEVLKNPVKAGRWPSLRADDACRRLLWVLSASLVMIGCVNPSGPLIYRDVLAMARHPVVLLQDEWQPLTFHLGSGGHWSYLIILALLIATQRRCPRWFSVGSVTLIIVYGVLPLLHQRMLIWWLMAAPWIMVRYWPLCGLRRLEQAGTATFRKTLLAGALVVLAGLWSIPTQWLFSGAPGKLERTLSAGTPWQLAALLRDSRQKVAPNLAFLARDLRDYYPEGRYTGCIFASETLGDSLHWELAPEIQVFIYTHVQIFTSEHWQRTIDVRNGTERWRQVLDEYRVNLVVVEPDRNPRLCELLRKDKGWHVDLDELNLATKRDPRNRHFVALRIPPMR
jgi:hypothetical protein